MKGNTSKRKMIVALAIAAIVVVAAIVSVVVVLAAPQQNVTSNVSVTYAVNDVSATVSARYLVKGGSVVTPDNNSITFTAEQETSTGSINFIDNDDSTTNTPATIGLSSTSNYVTFEYKFENNADKSFKVYLTGLPTPTNMNVTIATSATEVADMNTGLTFAAASVVSTPAAANQTASVASGDGSVTYVYIRAEINNLNTAASLSGAFAWRLDSAL